MGASLPKETVRAYRIEPKADASHGAERIKPRFGNLSTNPVSDVTFRSDRDSSGKGKPKATLILSNDTSRIRIAKSCL